MKQARSILAILLFGCAVMAVVDGVIQPGYAIKSLVKLTLFLGLPLWWSRQAKVSLRPLFARPRQGLRAQGFSEDECQAVGYDNALRVLRQTLKQ